MSDNVRAVKACLMCLAVLPAAAGLCVPCRADGLPGEHLLTQRWRELFAPYSALSNPSLLTEEDYPTLLGVFSPSMRNSFQTHQLSATLPIGLFQSAGLTWVRQGEPEHPSYDESFNRTGTVKFESNALVLSYAANVWGRLSVGTNVTVVMQNVFGEETRYSVPPGIDVGLSYRVLHHPILGYHVAGIAGRHVLQPTFETQTGETEKLSRSLQVNWDARLWEERIDVGVDFNLKDLGTESDEFLGGSGLEYEGSSRLGVWILRLIKLHGLFGFGENDLGYWGMGAGLNGAVLSMGRDLTAVYQYTMAVQEGLATSHSLYFRTEVGRHREEVWARKMSRLMDTTPFDLYNKAMALYYAGKYWEAFLIYGQLLGVYPEFHKNDWVSYYYSSCREEMDMRESAEEGYRDMTITYPRSDAVDPAELGIMRIAYRNDNHAMVEEQYGKLSTAGVRDSLRHHASYLMGESFLKHGRFARAEELLGAVPPGHPRYAFARHSLAIAHARQDDLEGARAALSEAMNITPLTRAQREVVNRSLLLAGYLYYEQGELPEAVSALRSVPAESYYREDALLGLGWCALKARQWKDCADAGEEAARVSNKPPVQAEAKLLKGYAALMEKKYDDAVRILREAYETIREATAPSADLLQREKNTYAGIREHYAELAESAGKLSKNRPTPEMNTVLDSMGTQQKKLKSEIDRFLVYRDEFARSSFFARRLDALRGDIEYALATAEKLQATVKQVQEEKKEQEKMEALDDQIEKVREEIEGVE